MHLNFIFISFFLVINTSVFLDSSSLSKQEQESGNKSYNETKKEIKSLKHEILSSKIPINSASKVFTNSWVDKIFPYWYGTKWSFEGHTNKPNEGEIACGYFVSTTLKDVGLNINRYHLAQKSPYNEAKYLSLYNDNEILELNSNPELAIETINCDYKEGIYFIGFNENHVGFLLKEKDNTFLIHSNYLNPSVVVKESINESSVFNSFSKFYIVPLSNNEKIIDAWLRGKPFE